MLARAIALRFRWHLTIAAFLAVSASASPALAQGRGHATARGIAPGQAKKQVTPAQAVTVSREMLVLHGFGVVRVETTKTGQVRGNNGRGRGLGPVEKMIVRPSGSIVVFEAAPEEVLLDIRLRLGL